MKVERGVMGQVVERDRRGIMALLVEGGWWRTDFDIEDWCLVWVMLENNVFFVALDRFGMI